MQVQVNCCLTAFCLYEYAYKIYVTKSDQTRTNLDLHIISSKDIQIISVCKLYISSQWNVPSEVNNINYKAQL